MAEHLHITQAPNAASPPTETTQIQRKVNLSALPKVREWPANGPRIGLRMSPRYRDSGGRSGDEVRSRFGWELSLLAQGRPIPEILRLVFGSSDGGRDWTERVLDVLSAYPSDKGRRKALETLLRTLEGMRRQGSRWRVTDRAGWVGQQTELVPATLTDDETGEVLEIPGLMRRAHVPARRAGGLSIRCRRSPRQLMRHRQAWRAGGVLRSQRTTKNMAGAVLPHQDAHWGYAQIWLGRPPSAELEQRLRDVQPPRLRGYQVPGRRRDEAATTAVVVAPPAPRPTALPGTCDTTPAMH